MVADAAVETVDVGTAVVETAVVGTAVAQTTAGRRPRVSPREARATVVVVVVVVVAVVAVAVRIPQADRTSWYAEGESTGGCS